jgi:hypothetical protein
MAVEHFSVTLQVWRYQGGPPNPTEFLKQLQIDPTDHVKARMDPNSRVDLLLIERSEFADAEEPSEAFVEELESRLTKIAQWLNKQRAGLFSELRESGFYTEILFSAWIDCDQMDLDLPVPFLEACSRLGLKISIITND